MQSNTAEPVEVVLCSVPRRREIARISPTVEVFPNVGLAYVTSAVRAAGHTVLQRDPAVEQQSIESFAREVAELQPRLLGMSCYTLDMYNAGALAQLVKQLSPATQIVVGGAHPGALPEPTLEEFPAFDFVVFGEGEVTTVELLRALRDRTSLDGITGLVHRKGSTVVKNPPRMQVPNLDDLPFPCYDGLPLDKYEGFFHWRAGDILPITTTRGCPFSCTFCYRTHGRSMRYRSIDNIIAEIEWNIDRYGRTRFCFTDETFSTNRKVTAALCEAMIARGLHRRIEWMAETRVDRIDAGLLSLMRQSGCHYIHYGIESGDEETQRAVSKDLKLDDVGKAIDAAHAVGIRTIGNFIIGHPYETPERIRKTIRFALEVNPTYAQFLIMTPYPGTEIYDMAMKGEGELVLLSRDWRDFGKVMEIAMELKHVKRAQLLSLQRWAYMRFYLRPTRILRLFEITRTMNLIKYFIYSLGQALLPSWKNVVRGRTETARLEISPAGQPLPTQLPGEHPRA